MSDINVGQISEALNNKVDLPSLTIPQDAVDYVVEMQKPTASNNYTYYRKYKSGWVEQGGRFNQPASSNDTVVTITISLPVVMQDNQYTFLSGGMLIQENGGTGGGWAGYWKEPSGSTPSTLVINGWRTNTAGAMMMYWHVLGFAAA